MRRLVFHGAVLALIVCLAPACRNKPQPSPEYDIASKLHSKVYAEKLDDAYLDERMTRAEEMLEKVAVESSDHAAAQALLARIRKERARMQAGLDERNKAVAGARTVTDFVGSRGDSREPAVKEPPKPPDPVEAHPQPSRGMPLKEFTSKHWDCFQDSAPIEVKGHGVLSTFELKNIAACRDRHPKFKDAVVLIKEEKVFETILRKDIQVERRLLDGGETPL